MNKVGYYIQATTESIQNALDSYVQGTRDGTFGMIDSDSQNAYPITGLTHFIMHQSAMRNCDSARELVRYVHWFMTDEKQRPICEKKRNVSTQSQTCQSNNAKFS